MKYITQNIHEDPVWLYEEFFVNQLLSCSIVVHCSGSFSAILLFKNEMIRSFF